MFTSAGIIKWNAAWMRRVCRVRFLAPLLSIVHALVMDHEGYEYGE